MEEVWGQRVTRAWADQFPIAPYRKLLLREQNPQGKRALEVGSGPAHDSLTSGRARVSGLGRGLVAPRA